jgi:hypothetical protein
VNKEASQYVKLFGGNKIGNLRPLQFLQRSEVQGAIYEGSQKIRFPI